MACPCSPALQVEFMFPAFPQIVWEAEWYEYEDKWMDMMQDSLLQPKWSCRVTAWQNKISVSVSEM